MVDIILVKGISPLSVSLNLELRDYCEACKALLDTRAELANIKHVMHTVEPDRIPAWQLKLENARKNYHLAEKAYQQERHEFELELMGLQGASHWGVIKKMLSEQCCLESPIEKELYAALTKAEAHEPTGPLAVESLDHSFVELLKNSIDAMRKQYLANVGDRTMLVMDVAFILEGVNIAVTITDNAGGFTDFYIKEFSANIQSKAYKYKTQVKEKRHYDEFSLGGAGRGMNILCNFIIDGEQLLEPGVSRKYYYDTEGLTDMHIHNYEKGAQIKLVSPITPFVLCREDSVSWISRENTPTSAFSFAREASPSFFGAPLQLARPPSSKKKASKITSSPLMPADLASANVESTEQTSPVAASPSSKHFVGSADDASGAPCEVEVTEITA
jgi:hypothetical protein